MVRTWVLFTKVFAPPPMRVENKIKSFKDNDDDLLDVFTVAY